MGSPHYIDTLRALNYSPASKAKFKELVDKVNSGDYSMNKAYKMATDETFMGADGKFKDNFSKWMQTARDEGWIDQAMELAVSLNRNRRDDGSWDANYFPPQPQPRPRSRTGLYVGIGVAVVAIGIFAYVSYKKNND